MRTYLDPYYPETTGSKVEQIGGTAYEINRKNETAQVLFLQSVEYTIFLQQKETRFS